MKLFLKIDPQRGTYNFVEETDALHALIDVLGVKFREIRNGGKHDAHVIFGLRVQLLLLCTSPEKNPFISNETSSVSKAWRNCVPIALQAI